VIARALHHVSFAITEIERSRLFYGKVLGLQEIERPNFPFAGAWYRVGAAEVHLIVPPADVDVGSRPARTHPMAGHAAFAIDDYASALEQLRGAGVQVLEAGAGRGQMWVQDPDGNVLEFIRA
jgi:catechol 2,3-dioxygenase-like lactoylglutathione lyase family enzyme